MPGIIGSFGYLYTFFNAGFIKQTQFHPGSILGEEGEINSLPVVISALGIWIPGSFHESFSHFYLQV